MRKISLEIASILVLLFSVNVALLADKNAFVTNSVVNETFNGLSALPTNWSKSTDAAGSLFASGDVNLTTPADRLNLTGSGSGNRGVLVKFLSNGTTSNATIEFDWTIVTATANQKNAAGVFLQDSLRNDILILYITGGDAYIHYQNIDNSTVAFDETSGAGRFLRGASTVAISAYYFNGSMRNQS